MKTPAAILEKFEQASDGLGYGTVTLTLSVKQGRHRYVIAREESIIPTDEITDRTEQFASTVKDTNRQ